MSALFFLTVALASGLAMAGLAAGRAHAGLKETGLLHFLIPETTFTKAGLVGSCLRIDCCTSPPRVVVKETAYTVVWGILPGRSATGDGPLGRGGGSNDPASAAAASTTASATELSSSATAASAAAAADPDGADPSDGAVCDSPGADQQHLVLDEWLLSVVSVDEAPGGPVLLSDGSYFGNPPNPARQSALSFLGRSVADLLLAPSSPVAPPEPSVWGPILQLAFMAPKGGEERRLAIEALPPAAR